MGTEWDDGCTRKLLTDPLNRAILSVLDDGPRTLDVEALFDRLVAHESTAIGPADERRRQQVLVSLHHTNLPKLDDAGVLSYDHTTNTVRSRLEPITDTGTEWTDGSTLDELFARLSPGGADSTIGVIEGRENVLDHGREITEATESELFIIASSGDLLDEGCKPYARAALERGVEIYMGLQDSDARAFARSHFPDVTLWEPQYDWLNTPSYPKLGRLFFADRNRVMLAILNEPDSSSDSPETAMTAEGAQNPLVVLVRELLGPRLDHLDYQSEDFLRGLPFDA